jgi:TolB-like protein
MPEPQSTAGAVFLSYAREDSEAARRIADALRAFGLEVWLDQSELRGGDSWDAKIKTQIRTCALFLPIISGHTQKRAEGYFRREWKFGVERTHDMAAGTAFVVPVVIDDTQESSALVPEEFMRFQWTRLPHGVPTSHFVDQIKQLIQNPRMSTAPERARSQAVPPQAPSATPVTKKGASLGFWAVGGAVVVGVVLAVAFFLTRRPDAPVVTAATTTQTKAQEAAPQAIDKSIAVLPFANFSPDKDNEFFADGMQDEVITALAKIHDLKVISRTSVLAYRNPEGRNLKKIGIELGVSTVLEGSVQRIGNKVHLNVQLIDARTDDHIWADSYTEEVTDVFSLESDLSHQIASALKARLTTDEQALIGRRPTQNQEAYDLYLRARVLQGGLGVANDIKDVLAIIALFETAGAKDPLFSLPHVQASILHGNLYWFSNFDPSVSRREKALAELEIAKRLAPDAPETRLAQGEYDYVCLNDWSQALSEYRAASIGLPNDSQVNYGIGRSLRRLSRFPESLDAFKRAALLNPNDDTSAFTVVEMTFSLHRYQAAVEMGKYYGERFPHEDYMQGIAIRARFQLDGDRQAMVRATAGLNPYGDKPAAVAYRQALLEGNLPGAEKALSDPELKTVLNETGSIGDPADLHRAFVAYLLGKTAEAREFSENAISVYRHSAWNARQKPWADIGIARAEAYAGRVDDAAHDGKAALAEMVARDGYDSPAVQLEYGRILVICDRREEAFSVLGEILKKPAFFAPREIPFDPVWSRLKDDPRMADLVNSVTPL